METNIIKFQATEIFYRTIGKGNPVVLLHGFGEDGDIWHNQIRFLQNYFRLVIPDIPGSGKSEFLQNANIETYCEIVKTIIEKEFKNEKVILLGHSMGGYITLSFAEKYPELLKAIGLIHSSAFADSDEKKSARKKSIEFIKINGADAFLKTAIPGLFTTAYNESHKINVDALIEKGKTFTSESLVQYYQAMIDRPDRIHVLKEAKFPVLFVIGEFDLAVPLQASLQQCHLPEISHIHIFNHSAHMSMLEEPEKLNQHLFDFLTTVL
jgi:pimeloyl-ACP methyl ester carboxylesterase